MPSRLRSSSVMNTSPAANDSGSSRMVGAPPAIHWAITSIFSSGTLLSLGRHLALAELGKQEALVRFAWHQSRAVFATSRDQPAQAQIEATLEFLLRSVAIEAKFLKDWTNVPLEGKGGLLPCDFG